MILGIIIAVELMLMIEILDISVKNEEDLESNYGIPVVGSIPNLEEVNVATNNAKNEGEANSDKNK